MHRRLGSATQLQVAFPGESNLIFPYYNTVAKKKRKDRDTKERENEGKEGGTETEKGREGKFETPPGTYRVQAGEARRGS